MFQKVSFHFKKLLIAIACSGAAWAAVATFESDNTQSKPTATHVTTSHSPANCNNTPVGSTCTITVTLTNSGDKAVDAISTLALPENSGWTRGENNCRGAVLTPTNKTCTNVYTYTPTDQTETCGTLNGTFTYRYDPNGQKAQETTEPVNISYGRNGYSCHVKSTFHPNTCENTDPDSSCEVSLTFTKNSNVGEIKNLKITLDPSDSQKGWKITSDPNACNAVDPSCAQTLSFAPGSNKVPLNNLVVTFNYDLNESGESSQTASLPYSVKADPITAKFYNGNEEITSIEGKPGDGGKIITLKLIKSSALGAIDSLSTIRIDDPSQSAGWAWSANDDPLKKKCESDLNTAPNFTCTRELIFNTKKANKINSQNLILHFAYRIVKGSQLRSETLNSFTYSSTSDLLKWKTDLLNPVMSNPIINTSGDIFVTTSNGTTHQIQDSENVGSVSKTFTAQYGTLCEGPTPDCPTTPVLNADETKLYVSSSGGISFFNLPGIPNADNPPFEFIKSYGGNTPAPTNPLLADSWMYFSSASYLFKYNLNQGTEYTPEIPIYATGNNGITILANPAQAPAAAFDEGDDPIFTGGKESPQLYFGTSDGRLHGINSANSCPVWLTGEAIPITTPKANFSSPLSSPTAVTKNGIVTVYIGDSDGKVTAVDPSGSQKLIFNCAIQNCKIITKPIVGDDGTLYVGTYDGGISVYGIDPSSSNPNSYKWKFTTQGDVIANPVPVTIGAGDNKKTLVFVTSKDGNLYALDPSKYALGNNKSMELWEFSTGHGVYTSPVVNTKNTTVYFGDNSSFTGGFFYALDYSKGLSQP